MPNPKYGTVSADIAATVQRLQKGEVQFRNDKGGTISVSIGRKSFTDEHLTANFYAFFNHIMRLRPKGISGSDIQVGLLHETLLCARPRMFVAAASTAQHAMRCAAACMQCHAAVLCVIERNHCVMFRHCA